MNIGQAPNVGVGKKEGRDNDKGWPNGHDLKECCCIFCVDYRDHMQKLRKKTSGTKRPPKRPSKGDCLVVGAHRLNGLARDIFDALVNTGVEMGDVSVTIIEKVLEKEINYLIPLNDP